MITFEGKTYEPRAGETILECLTRAGVSVPSFCRNGACQTCLVKATRGVVPKRAQAGLKDAWVQQGFLLACVCSTETELELERCEGAKLYPSRIVDVRALSPRVALVRLERPRDLQFHAGQFLQLVRPGDAVSRPYSIASLPEEETLDLHVAIQPGGEFSPWLIASSRGASIDVRGPFGECFYLSGEEQRPLVFAGVGTGLAPLVGIVRTAIARGHSGPMRLYHGALTERDLYFTSELSQLARQSECQVTELSLEALSLSEEGPRVRRVQGDLVDLVLHEVKDPGEPRFYLCGAPELVHRLKKKLYLKGASLSRIHADPFFAKSAATPQGAAS